MSSIFQIEPLNTNNKETHDLISKPNYCSFPTVFPSIMKIFTLLFDLLTLICYFISFQFVFFLFQLFLLIITALISAFSFKNKGNLNYIQFINHFFFIQNSYNQNIVSKIIILGSIWLKALSMFRGDEQDRLVYASFWVSVFYGVFFILYTDYKEKKIKKRFYWWFGVLFFHFYDLFSVPVLGACFAYNTRPFGLIFLGVVCMVYGIFLMVICGVKFNKYCFLSNFEGVFGYLDIPFIIRDDQINNFGYKFWRFSCRLTLVLGLMFWNWGYVAEIHRDVLKNNLLEYFWLFAMGNLIFAMGGFIGLVSLVIFKIVKSIFKCFLKCVKILYCFS